MACPSGLRRVHIFGAPHDCSRSYYTSEHYDDDQHRGVFGTRQTAIWDVRDLRKEQLLKEAGYESASELFGDLRRASKEVDAATGFLGIRGRLSPERLAAAKTRLSYLQMLEGTRQRVILDNPRRMSQLGAELFPLIKFSRTSLLMPYEPNL